MSFLTCFCDLPQKEHFSRSPPSPMRATRTLSLFRRAPVTRASPALLPALSHDRAVWGRSVDGPALDGPALDGAAPRRCWPCLLYTSPSPRDGLLSRMPS